MAEETEKEKENSTKCTFYEGCHWKETRVCVCERERHTQRERETERFWNTLQTLMVLTITFGFSR